jgi:hypothetical protein
MGRIKAGVEAADISAAVLSRLSGIPQSTLKEALADQRYLGNKVEADLLTLVVRVSSLAEAWRPMVFARGDSESIRALLESEAEPSKVREMVSTIFGRESE